MAYRLTAEARAELDEIWYYIAIHSSTDTAERIIAALTERFEMLSDFPKVGRARDDLGAGRRGFPVEDYVIVYRLDGSDVLILHVVDGCRDLPELLGSE